MKRQAAILLLAYALTHNLFLYLAIYDSIHLSIHLSIHYSIHHSVCLSICLSVVQIISINNNNPPPHHVEIHNNMSFPTPVESFGWEGFRSLRLSLVTCSFPERVASSNVTAQSLRGSFQVTSLKSHCGGTNSHASLSCEMVCAFHQVDTLMTGELNLWCPLSLSSFYCFVFLSVLSSISFFGSLYFSISNC